MSAVAQLSARKKATWGGCMAVYRESPRTGYPHAVETEADLADMTERQLTSDGRCNWLIGYGQGVNTYCGTPAHEVCKVHAWYAKGWL